MVLGRLFFLTFTMFLILWGFLGEASEECAAQKNPQIHQIDLQIQELEQMKLGYESRAIRHDNQAERLQFENQAYLEARRHIQLANENRAKAAAVQKEIDRLKTQRQQLLQQEG